MLGIKTFADKMRTNQKNRHLILFLILALFKETCFGLELTTKYSYAVADAHAAMVTTISFYNDGSKFVTGSKDNTAKIWSMTNGTLLETKTYADWVVHISLHPVDNRIFILCIDGKMEVLDPDSYSQLSLQMYPGGGLSSGTYLRFFDSNSKYLVAGYDDIAGTNTIYAFDASTYINIGASSIPTSFDNFAEIMIMSVSRDGSTLAAISGNSAPPIPLEIYDISGASITRTFMDNYALLKWVLFSPHQDDMLYTTSNDKTLKFYQKSPLDSSYTHFHTFYTDLYGFPNCINANIEGTVILSANNNLVFISLSDTHYPSVYASQADQANVFVFDLSADQRYLGTGMENGEVTIWEKVSQEEGEDQGSENNYRILIILVSAFGGLAVAIVLGIGLYRYCCKVGKVKGERNETEATLENKRPRRNNFKRQKSSLQILENPNYQ